MQASVKFLGLGCKRSNVVKENLRQALRVYPTKLELVEISEVDEILQYNISGVPAILVNDQVLFQNTVPAIEDILDALEKKLAHKTFVLKTIIVPTDFSSTSSEAFQFALELAHRYHATLKLVHIFKSNFDAPSYVSSISRLKKIKEKLLADFLKNQFLKSTNQNLASIEVDKELILGFPGETVINLSKSADTDLIIMGTTGESGLLEKVFGSVSSIVSQKAHCPVLLIPPGFTFSGFKNILYASNFEPLEKVLAKKVVHFARQFSADMHVVHVEDGKNAVRHNGNGQFAPFVKKRDKKSPPFTKTLIRNASVLDGLNQYVAEHHIDLIAMVTKQRGFWSNLLHKSITKRMALNTKVPLMVLHID